MSCLQCLELEPSGTGLTYVRWLSGRVSSSTGQMNPTVSTWDPNYTRISAPFVQEPMLENLGHAQSKRSIAPREFFLPVEVYISNQAAAALRKVPSCLFYCGVHLSRAREIA